MLEATRSSLPIENTEGYSSKTRNKQNLVEDILRRGTTTVKVYIELPEIGITQEISEIDLPPELTGGDKERIYFDELLEDIIESMNTGPTMKLERQGIYGSELSDDERDIILYLHPNPRVIIEVQRGEKDTEKEVETYVYDYPGVVLAKVFSTVKAYALLAELARILEEEVVSDNTTSSSDISDG